MGSLILTFGDMYNRVSDFLGTGATPTGTPLTDAQDIVHRGYRQFLYPINPKTGRTHLWSFLKTEAMIITQEGVLEYELPDDFGYFWYPPKYDSDVNRPNPQPTSVARLRALLSIDSSNTYPQLFSITADRYDPLTGQRYKLMFYPTPDSNYTFRYGYIIEPVKLVNSTDLFIGGTRSSEAILEYSLAVAEQQEDDTIGIHTQLAAKLTVELINADLKNTPDSLGTMNLSSLSLDNPALAREMRVYPTQTEIYGVSL